MNKKEDFANVRFTTECSQITLVKNDESESIAVSGPGELWQEISGAMRFKVFAGGKAYSDLFNYVGRPQTSGELVAEEDYFTLSAQTFSGELWVAKRVLPAIRGGYSEGFACGRIRELSQTIVVPNSLDEDALVLRFRGKLEFPCNQHTKTIVEIGGRKKIVTADLNAAFITSGDLNLEIYHEDEHTVLVAFFPPGIISATTPNRFSEALQFVIGQELALLVTEIRRGGVLEIRLQAAPKRNGKLPPPLGFGAFDEEGHVWRLFETFLSYIRKNEKSVWHPISNHISSALQSTAASLDAEVLALTVAVEGLADICFRSLAPADPAFLEFLNGVEAALPKIRKDVAIDDGSFKRIVGTLNQMRKSRNSDVLRAFSSKYRLPAGQFGSWKKLRNRSAHGGGLGGREIDQIMKDKHEVLSLFYSIVFAAIGYVGPRTEYGTRDWPCTLWPVDDTA